MESRLYPEDRFRLWPIAVLSVVFVIAAPLFWREVEMPPAAGAPTVGQRDLTEFYAPVYERAYGQMRSGELPVWDPTRLCGAPVAADPRVGVFQPLNAVFLLAPFPEALAIHAFACLAMAGITFAVFARAIGLGMTAALFGGICYAFSGPAAAAMTRPPLAVALAWVPLVLWSAREHGMNPRMTTVVFFGMTMAGLLLSGALAVFAWTVVLAGCYAVTVNVSNRFSFGRLFRTMGGWFGALCLCACISAVQLLPSIRLALQLADPLAMITTVAPQGDLPGSLRNAMTTVLSPGRFAKPSLIYLGVVAIAFIPAAWFSRSRFVEALFFTIIAAGATLFVTIAPDRMPEPAALMAPAIACAAMAAALGIDRFTRQSPVSKRRWVAVAAVVTLAALVGLFIAGSSLARGYAIFAVIALVVMTLTRRPTIRAVAGLLLVGLVWTDLVTASRVTDPLAPHDQTPATPIQTGPGRLAYMGQPGLTSYDQPSAGGFGALLTRPQAAWWSALSPDASHGTFGANADEPLLRAMAVRTIVEDSQRRGDVRPLESPLPRAYWVPSIAWSESIDVTVNAIQNEPRLLNRTALVPTRYQSVPELQQLADADPATSADTTATLQDRADDHVVVTINAAAPGVLVLTDSFSTNWAAEIDGEPARLLRVNGIFRGVAIPEGSHVIEFRYRYTTFYAGAAISIGVLAILALWGIVRLFQ